LRALFSVSTCKSVTFAAEISHIAYFSEAQFVIFGISS
jgi:hypothetical protein